MQNKNYDINLSKSGKTLFVSDIVYGDNYYAELTGINGTVVAIASLYQIGMRDMYYDGFDKTATHELTHIVIGLQYVDNVGDIKEIVVNAELFYVP